MGNLKYNVLFVMMLMVSILSGCATPRGNTISLPGTSWTLVTMDGVDTTSDITLKFEDAQLNGNASCNNYFTQYTLDGANLSLGPVGSTMMACPDMDDESRYLAALGDVKQVRFDGDQLVLVSSGGKDLLVFVPMQHASLEGPTWTLTGWNNGTGFSSIVIDTEVTLELTEGQASGKAGCNNYFGNYAYADEGLTFGPIANTEMYCMEPEGVMEQETGYLQALGRSASISIEGTVLTVFDEDGTRLLTFTTAE